MHYNIYRPVHELLARHLREQLKADKAGVRRVFGVPLKKVDPDDLFKFAIRMKVEYNRGQSAADGAMSMDTIVLVEEWQWRQDACHVYFPLPGLLAALYDSKMEVEPDALVFPHRSFTLAIPRGEEVGGMQLPPVLVTAASVEEKRGMLAAFSKKVVPGMDISLKTEPEAKRSLFITYGQDKGEGYGLIRCSVPFDRLGLLLNNPTGEDREGEYMREVVGDYKDVPGLIQMTDEERRVQYRLAKSMVNLAIYMLAFPESVRDGYPEQFVDDRCGSRDKDPHTVGGQHFHAHGDHASPIGHWRRKHFRSYPRKRDGTKKDGLVVVKGTWVNPDSPHTVGATDSI